MSSSTGRFRILVPAAGIALCTLASAQSLNEIYASHTGTDDQEFVEIKGTGGASLDGMMLLVIEGDGASAGTLDRAFDLTGMTMPLDGYFVAGNTAVANLDFDFGTSNVLENGTETFYLISTNDVPAIVSLLGTNVDGDADLVTDIALMAGVSILDVVAMVDSGFGSTDFVYDGAQALGPDSGGFFPAGIFRGSDAPNGWCVDTFLDFNLGPDRTPGAANIVCPPVGPSPVVILAGDDGMQTLPNGNSRVDFSTTPIPADFFFPGSDPFFGEILLTGSPIPTLPSGALGSKDTVVRRLADTVALGVGDSDTVPIQLVALHLVSLQPIVVSSGSCEQWNVEVCLSSVAAPAQGSATIHRNCADGGTMDTVLPVQTKLVFTSTGGGPSVTLDPAPSLQFQSTGLPWTLIGGPGGFDPVANGLSPTQPGIAVDGDRDGAMEDMTIGASNLQPSWDGCVGPGPDPAIGTDPSDWPHEIPTHSHVTSDCGDLDTDSDGWPDKCDNCKFCYNADPKDSNNDGIGDACPGPIACGSIYNFCESLATSQCTFSWITYDGSSSIAADDLVLIATGLPPNIPGIFFYGPNEIAVPFGNGIRCVGGGINRLNVSFSNGGGVMSRDFDIAGAAVTIVPDSVWKFQAWFRDVAAGGSLFNLSNGLSVTFIP